MTVTRAGGTELFTTLSSVEVGTLGGHFQMSFETEPERYVGAHLSGAPTRRRTPSFPLFPFYHDQSEEHSVHDKYESLFCVLGYPYIWIEDVKDSDPWGILFSAEWPKQVVLTGKDEAISPRNANTKVTLNLAFVDPE